MPHHSRVLCVHKLWTSFPCCKRTYKLYFLRSPALPTYYKQLTNRYQFNITTRDILGYRVHAWLCSYVTTVVQHREKKMPPHALFTSGLMWIFLFCRGQFISSRHPVPRQGRRQVTWSRGHVKRTTVTHRATVPFYTALLGSQNIIISWKIMATFMRGTK